MFGFRNRVFPGNSFVRSRAWAAALLLAMMSACTDAGPSAPDAAGADADAMLPAQPVVAAYTCGVSLARETVTCAQPSPGSSGARMIRVFGAQNVEVRLRSFNSAYDDSTGVLSADVTIMSLVNEWLGTPDSTTVTGVRAFFHEGPTVVLGEGSVDVLGDGLDTFTGGLQPYYDYDQIIKPLETSAPREWRFQVPPTVEEFSFTVLLLAETTGIQGVPLTPAPTARVLLDGLPYADTGAVLSPADLVVTNGLLRLTLASFLGGRDHGAHVIEGWSGSAWAPLNQVLWGDWTFVGSAAMEPHTAAEVLVNTDTLVGVRWTFANHTVPARYQDSTYTYGFTKTVWLRAMDRGYYVWFEVLDSMPPGVTSNEYEVGWGGVTAAGQISTSDTTVSTDSLTNRLRLHTAGKVDAAQFDVYGSGWRRVLVPLPTQDMMIGVFDGNSYGIWAFSVGKRQSFGAYVYAAPTAQATPTRALCGQAIARSPFELPEMDASECGPAS